MISFSGISRFGGRPKNEDYFKIWNEGGSYLFALADGLGGHKMGDAASRLVVETSINVASRRLPGENILDSCFTEGQQRLLQEQKRLNMINDMKTTQVLLYINENRASWGHVGDSRLYRFRKGVFSYKYDRTIDHSVVQNMALTGQIKEKDMRFHPDRNRLLRVMGTEWESPRYTIDCREEIKDGDSYLLCTDGFWEWVDEKNMSACLKGARSPDEWLNKMEQIILKNTEGKDNDNYTAVAVFARKG